MGTSIWSRVIRAKYMDNQDMTFWYRQRQIGSSNGSAIWRGFHRMEPFFRKNLIWKFHFGSKLMIGIDDFAGAEEKIIFFTELLRALHNRGYFFLGQHHSKIGRSYSHMENRHRNSTQWRTGISMEFHHYVYASKGHISFNGQRFTHMERSRWHNCCTSKENIFTNSLYSIGST